MNVKDKQIIEILLTIGYICGVSPISSLSKTEDLRKVPIGILFVIFSILLCIFSLYFNARDAYINMKKMDMYVDLISMIFNGLLGIVIVSGPLFYASSWQKLLIKLTKSVELIQLTKNQKQTNNRVYTEIITFHVMFIARFSWDAFVWISCRGINIYKNYLYRIYNEYCAMIAILIMVHLNLVIQNYFKLLNNSLCVIKSRDSEMQKRTPNDSLTHKIKDIQIAYRKLSKLIDHFNMIFGYQILLLMGYTVAVTLGSLHSALQYNNFNEKIDAMVLSWSVISSTIILVSFRFFPNLL